MATLTETRRQVARDLAALEAELDLSERYADNAQADLGTARTWIAAGRGRLENMRRKAAALGIGTDAACGTP